MEIKELLKKKLKADKSFAYKFDEHTSLYYNPDQAIFEFPPGTSLEHMTEWVYYYGQLAEDKGLSVTISSIKASENGICIVGGNNTGMFSSGFSGIGRPGPPPPPVVFKDYLRAAIVPVEFVIVADSDRLTAFSKSLSR